MHHPAPAHIPDLIGELRANFARGITRPLEWRLAQLRNLRDLLQRHSVDFQQALAADLGKCASEAHFSEIGFLLVEIDYALKHLRAWARATPVRVPVALHPASAKVLPEPVGVVLVIAPWNYPLMLALSPLIGALAAGNAVVLKPSELAPATAALLAQLLPTALDPRATQVVCGAVAEATTLLEQRFAHIFYTGNGRVGKIVALAAAAHLTPVTLELGGKSPVYIDDTVSLPRAAKRIVWGKFLNAGQTCVAPDYVLGTPAVLARLEPFLVAAIRDLYGDQPLQNPDYGRIVNQAHFQRLRGYLGDGRLVTGGEQDQRRLAIAPTVLAEVSAAAPVMQEEIFGPILPLVPIADLNAALQFVNNRDKPLASYVFSNDAAVRQRWELETSSGALNFGVPVLHLAVPELPFGGVGASGIGAYHGAASFKLFSHHKAILTKPLNPETLAATVMPPYTKSKQRLIKNWLAKLL